MTQPGLRRTISLGSFPTRAKLRTMRPEELLDLAQRAEDMEIHARLVGDRYGMQVCRERRHLAEREHAEQLRHAAWRGTS